MNTSFGIGNVLSTGFRVWFRNLVPFLLITAVLYIPPWLWAWHAVHVAPTLDNFNSAKYSPLIASYLTLPVNVFVAATLTYGVVMELHGQRAPLTSCITTGLSRFFPALAVGAVSWICVIAASVTVVGGVIVLCMLYVATPVAVLERAGILGALSRSSALTSGHKWKILGLFLVLMLLGVGADLVLRAMVLDTGPQPVDVAFASLHRQVYVDYANQVVFGSLGAVMASVSYYLLRAEKEGTSAAELAAIFD